MSAPVHRMFDPGPISAPVSGMLDPGPISAPVSGMLDPGPISAPVPGMFKPSPIVSNLSPPKNFKNILQEHYAKTAKTQHFNIVYATSKGGWRKTNSWS
jgi:hypothetical protein